MLQIAIGRNMNDTGLPMNESLWLRFEREVITVVNGWTGQYAPNTIAYGKSSWQGVAEETCLLVWFDVESLPSGALFGLKNIASQYWQDAIAVTFGNTEFVSH